MKLIEIETRISDFCTDTVEVSIKYIIDKKERSTSYYIQTVDGEYRGDLGCWITTGTGGEDMEFSEEELLAYETFDVMSIASDFLEKAIVYKGTGCYLTECAGELVLKITEDGVDVVIENNDFINSDTSSYQRAYGDAIKSFDSEEEAMEWVEEASE